MTNKLLLHSIQELVQVSAGRGVLYGEAMGTVDVCRARGNEGLCIVVDQNGFIEAIGYDDTTQNAYKECGFEKTIDCSGCSVIPGLVDAHTHPVWAGDRLHEFKMKLSGASYMEIHESGGGIHFTVEKTREAPEEELLQSFTHRLRQMLNAGTTLVECKSGYGLEMETEFKQLRVIDKARRDSPIDISSTFLGAHAVPKDSTAEKATDLVINQMIPKLNELMTKGELTVDNIDVFCEKGVFDVEQSRRILLAGKRIGLNLNFHGDELTPFGSAEMGTELGALAISHLEEVSQAGIEAMAQSKTVAVVLPTTAYILRLQPPPVRRMIEAGVAVALGSDFNPNAYCLSMPLVMHLACILCRMSLSEALSAATINAAAAIGKSDSHGSLEVGKVANMVILNTEKWENLVYKLGCQEELIGYVITHGDIVHQNQKSSP